MLCEIHKKGSVIKPVVKSQRFSVSYSPPEDTLRGGTHAGETVLLGKGYQSRWVPKEYDDVMKSDGVLRFAAQNITFHNVDSLFLTVYLWDEGGLGERSNNILKQIYVLQKFYSSCWFCCAEDFLILLVISSLILDGPID